MILGFLGGLIFGCLMAAAKYWQWRALAPMLHLNEDHYPQMDSLLYVLIGVILGVLFGAMAGWR